MNFLLNFVVGASSEKGQPSGFYCQKVKGHGHCAETYRVSNSDRLVYLTEVFGVCLITVAV